VPRGSNHVIFLLFSLF